MANGKYTSTNNYHYVPSEAWCAVFIVLFSLSAIVHCFQAWRSKRWVIFPTLVLGALIEILGWSARLWSSQNILLLTPFLMQICTLIMAPVWFSAFDYTALGMAITKLGPEYSVLRPGWYFIVFLTADVISLILQAVGGGQAASSAANAAPTTSATNIMFAGIVFQLISMAIFLALAIDFIVRRQTNRPYAFRQRQVAAVEARRRSDAGAEKGLTVTASEGSSGTATPIAPGVVTVVPHSGEVLSDREMRGWMWFMFAVGVSSIMIIIRGVYRSIELHQGWTGFLMEHQIYQNVLDGIPMVIAVAIFNIFSPIFFLPARNSWKGVH